MNKRVAAIAIAACVCALLFSAAASARQAAGTITVTGVVIGNATNGTYVQFDTPNFQPPFKQISLSGGSNFHFSIVPGRLGGGPCKLTPTNGGVACDFTGIFPGGATNLYVNTIISGALPAAVAGKVVYEDGSTGTFSAPITEGPPGPLVEGKISPVVQGSSIQISVANFLPQLRQFSVDGGSNWQITAISSTAGGSCDLTPSNAGGSCAFAKTVMSFVLTVTFTGPPPTVLSGEFTWVGIDGPYRWTHDFRGPCRCTKTTTELTGFKKRAHGDKLVFFLKWKLDCNVGSTDFESRCVGAIVVHHPRLPQGLQLTQPDGKAWNGGTLYFKCLPKQGRTCKPTVTGEKELELIAPAAARAHATLSFHMGLHCGAFGPRTRTTTEDLTI